MELDDLKRVLQTTEYDRNVAIDIIKKHQLEHEFTSALHESKPTTDDYDHEDVVSSAQYLLVCMLAPL